MPRYDGVFKCIALLFEVFLAKRIGPFDLDFSTLQVHPVVSETTLMHILMNSLYSFNYITYTSSIVMGLLLLLE